MYYQLVDSEWSLPSFRSEHVYQPGVDPEELRSIDCSKQYATAIYTATHRWIQFSKLDFVEPFGGEICDGVFFVKSFAASFIDDLSWEGPRWYPRQWIDFHLYETKRITLNDITHMIKASFTYPAEMFQPLIKELFFTMGSGNAKTIVNRFIGLMEILTRGEEIIL